jgi:hypothetical protein
MRGSEGSVKEPFVFDACQEDLGHCEKDTFFLSPFLSFLIICFEGAAVSSLSNERGEYLGIRESGRPRDSGGNFEVSTMQVPYHWPP